MRPFALVPFVLLAACGGDDGGKSPIDAKVTDSQVFDAEGIDAKIPDAAIDAAPATVIAVACPNDVSSLPKITTTAGAYSPSTLTISQDDVVYFDMPQGSNHDVAPSTTMPSDPGLVVGFNSKACLQFTATGTFNFRCSIHGFTGSITVQ